MVVRSDSALARRKTALTAGLAFPVMWGVALYDGARDPKGGGPIYVLMAAVTLILAAVFWRSWRKLRPFELAIEEHQLAVRGDTPRAWRWRDIEAAWVDEQPAESLSFRTRAGARHTIRLGGFDVATQQRIIAEVSAMVGKRFVPFLRQPIC